MKRSGMECNGVVLTLVLFVGLSGTSVRKKSAHKEEFVWNNLYMRHFEYCVESRKFKWLRVGDDLYEIICTWRCVEFHGVLYFCYGA